MPLDESKPEDGDGKTFGLTIDQIGAEIRALKAALNDGALDFRYATLVGEVKMWPTETVPDGWLECNGQAVSRTTYAALFAVISDDYGNGDGSTTFNLPKISGRTVRGWDHGEGVDPDAASRTDRGDGTTGDHVGTKQADEFKEHHHDLKILKISASGSLRWVVNVSGGWVGDYTENVGGAESRGKNIAMMFIIKC